MEKREQLYEGKAKKVYATDDENLVIVSYKDDATAFDGLKKGTITGKGVVNNKMSNRIMQLLEKNGVPTHFVQELSDRDTLVKKVKIVPLEVIIRNISAGLGVATWEEIDTIKAMAFKINSVMKEFFLSIGVKLVDFKLEFGKTADGEIVLADEISPDTCRFWDAKTNEKLDKDRFRRDLGNVEDAYAEMMRRVFG